MKNEENLLKRIDSLNTITKVQNFGNVVLQGESCLLQTSFSRGNSLFSTRKTIILARTPCSSLRTLLLSLGTVVRSLRTMVRFLRIMVLSLRTMVSMSRTMVLSSRTIVLLSRTVVLFLRRRVRSQGQGVLSRIHVFQGKTMKIRPVGTCKFVVPILLKSIYV